MAMASSGYIYTQVLSEESSAQHGPFYVTNVLQIQHQDLKASYDILSLTLNCNLDEISTEFNVKNTNNTIIFFSFPNRTAMAKLEEEEYLYITLILSKSCALAILKERALLHHWSP